MVAAPTRLTEILVAEAQHLFHLFAIETLQTRLQIDLVVLGLVLIFHGAGGAHFQTTNPVDDLA